jgi:hypothetical protein
MATATAVPTIHEREMGKSSWRTGTGGSLGGAGTAVGVAAVFAG